VHSYEFEVVFVLYMKKIKIKINNLLTYIALFFFSKVFLVKVRSRFRVFFISLVFIPTSKERKRLIIP
jgi:hypothetical protein